MKCEGGNCRVASTFDFVRFESRRVTSKISLCDELNGFRSTRVFSHGTRSQVPGLIYVDFELSVYHASVEERPFCLYLHEIGGARRFATMMDVCAWAALAGQIEQRQTPRPPTHIGWMTSIRRLGGELQDVLVGTLRKDDGWYDSWLRIRINGELVTVDVRPSDAYTLVAVTGSPIAIYEDSLESIADDRTKGDITDY